MTRDCLIQTIKSYVGIPDSFLQVLMSSTPSMMRQPNIKVDMKAVCNGLHSVPDPVMNSLIARPIKKTWKMIRQQITRSSSSVLLRIRRRTSKRCSWWRLLIIVRRRCITGPGGVGVPTRQAKSLACRTTSEKLLTVSIVRFELSQNFDTSTARAENENEFKKNYFFWWNKLIEN